MAEIAQKDQASDPAGHPARTGTARRSAPAALSAWPTSRLARVSWPQTASRLLPPGGTLEVDTRLWATMSSGVDHSALRTARERLGLTQHQLARQIGVAGGERISRWELGLDEPRPELLVRIARVLNAPVGDLLGVDDAYRDLKALRYCAGLSVTALAAAVHVSPRSYTRWESGAWVRPPSERNIRAIAGALSVHPDTVRDALANTKNAGTA